MIAYTNVGVANCLVVTFSGRLSGVEYRDMIEKLERIIQESGSANLVMSLHDLEFPEWDAVKADFHFGTKDYRSIRRAAFVGSQTWMEWFVKLMSPFTRTQERFFQADQLSEAVQWACSDV